MAEGIGLWNGESLTRFAGFILVRGPTRCCWRATRPLPYRGRWTEIRLDDTFMKSLIRIASLLRVVYREEVNGRACNHTGLS